MREQKLLAALRRWWWLALVVLLATLVGWWVTQGESDEYLATGTYVVRPTGFDRDAVIRASRGLVGSAKIDGTYAFIIESDRVADRAYADLGLDRDVDDVEIAADVVPGSNIVTVAVRSPNPELAYALATALGDAAVEYVQEFDPIYGLSPLDPPSLPTRPEPEPLSLVGLTTATLAGLTLGGLASLAADGQLSRRRPVRPAHATMSHDLDTAGEGYARLRLREEMSRTDESGTPFEFAVIRIRAIRSGDERSGRANLAALSTDLERAVLDTLHVHDHFAALDSSQGPGVFIAILPGLGDRHTDKLADSWGEAASDRLHHGQILAVSTAFCRYADHRFTGHHDATRMAELLSA